MATSSISDEAKWKRCSADSGREEEEEEEEEALSLCDLPVNLINEEDQSSREEAQETNAGNQDQEFDFVPLLGGNSCVSSKSEMCAADDIFFQGQMLPLRHSVSSENKFKHDSLNPSRCVSRSQSMDHGHFTSFSSRSSSTRSDHYSSSSNSSSNNIIGRSSSCPGISNPTRRIYNPFHAHPSPKPQIRLSSSSSLGNAASRKSCSSSSSSSVWDFFRFGLVRTPEIELQDLKFRASVSRNSSSNSSTQSNSSIGKKKVEKQSKQGFFDKRRALISGCSCSVGTAVKPVPLNHSTIINKSSRTSTAATATAGKGKNEKSEKRDDYHHYRYNHHYQSMDEKLKEMKKKKKTVEKQKQKQEDKEEEEKRKKGSSSGKQAMSRHRTFEWIKELSHASFLDHEQREGGGHY